MKVLILVLAVLGTALAAERPLPRYNVDRTKISVSGASSGGSMATQMHVAYSSLIMGAGILAGSPYYCAQGSLVTAGAACANLPENINVNDLVRETNKYASAGEIDDTSNMFGDRIAIFSGNLDTVVHPGVADKIQEYYRNYVSNANVMIIRINAQHTFPTNNYGNPCDVVRRPYLGNCSYDAAHATLNHIYPGLTKPTGFVPQSGDFYKYDQTEFFYRTLPEDASMDVKGYVYVPTGCMSGENRCRLHVVFHGCDSGSTHIGEEFVRNAGYNEVGELNNIIILYPQLVSTINNPMACWDWWGYTHHYYVTKAADQALAVANMINRIS